MIMQEHNENYFTEENTDIEKYLLRIIRRYFDTENIYSQASIESIIVEALTRYKREIYIEQCKFLFSLNGKTGRLMLTIQDFGGEYAFEKNNAFNKDFGSLPDTICEGNDDRLSDKRKPLKHVHDIGDITGLRNKLDSFLINLQASHYHPNQDVLNVLTYTSNSVKIDLIIVEELLEKMELYCNQINKMKLDLWSSHVNDTDKIGRVLFAAKEELASAKEFTIEALKWIDDIKSYIKKTANDLKVDTTQRLTYYLKNNQLEDLIEYIQHIYVMTDSGEIPIPDEDLHFNFKEDEDYEYKESVEGEGIRNIYLNGLCFGTVGDMNWIWDESLQSIVELNNTTKYTGYVSTGSFKKYTHRVTLKSTNNDDDMITVIALYNRATGNHLEVVCTAGNDGNSYTNPTTAELVYNFGKTGKTVLDTISFEIDNGWSSIEKGMTVLIKRDENNLKVWVIYNKNHNWVPFSNDIIPSQQPTFDINFNDYPVLAEFVDQSACYGYGCFSQANSTYSDIFFVGAEEYGTEKPGETIITGSSTVEQSMSTVPDVVVNGKAKLFFRYDKDGKEYTVPMPYVFKIPTGHCVIQGYQDDDGKIHVDANIVNKLSGHIGPENVYDEKTIIFSSAIHKDYYFNVNKDLTDRHCTLCRIDDANKKEFIKNIIRDNSKIYFVNAYREIDDDQWVTYDENENRIELPFTETSFENGISGRNVCMDAQGKLYTVDGVTSKNGYIAQFIIQRVSNYFDNPRIYYQVYKEGM